MDEAKREFAKHLQSIGYEFNVSREVVLEKLRKRMGEDRFKQFQGRGHTAHDQEEFYKIFQDIIEANLMRSLDGCATLDASFSLYQRCTSRLDRGTRVLELGCWTGGLASFIATRHPQCTVVGADFADEVVKACSAHYKLPNLRFQRWNYRFGKPEKLEPADVLLCSMGVVHHLPNNATLPEIDAVRRSREYVTQRDHAIGYFGLWRTAANDGAALFAVLRISLFARFLAWMDAAQEVGWTPRLDRLWHTDMTGEKGPLPGLMFEAKKCDPLPEEAIIDKWTWFTRRDHLYACIEGAPALAAFRALTSKKVLASRNFRRTDGLLTRDEVGLAGGTGYVFTHDAVFQFRLLLVSQARAEELAAQVSVKDSSTPIANDGWFQRPAAATTFGGAFFSDSNRTIGGAIGSPAAKVACLDD